MMLIFLALPLILLLLILVSLWVRAVSKGPVMFRQERIGRGGRRFMLYKFRSMKAASDNDQHAEHIRAMILSGSPLRKLDELGDPRLITGGCFLRATGLDELPQIFNVIRGEMSLVGPRPCLPFELEFFAGESERFRVLPGITGKWQVNGKNALTFDQMIEHDRDYSERSSLSTDFGILARTPWVILRQVGVCIARRAAGYPEADPNSNPNPCRMAKPNEP